MTDPVRIANCSGFYGDRLSAAREMVDGGPIDVLTGDWLAELTMLILWKGYQRDRSKGWAHTFLTQMEEVLGTCADRNIKVVTNAGGLNPAGLADQVRALAERLGLRCRWPTSKATTCFPGSTSCAGRASPGPPRHRPAPGRGRRRGHLGQRLPGRLAHRGGPRWGGRCGDLSPDHRRLAGGGPGGLAPRLVGDRLGQAGRCGGGRPRHRVRTPGHRRQLRLLHRGRRDGASRASPSPRWRRRLVGDHQAPGHRRPGVRGDGHRPAALRDRRPPLSQHRRGGPLRHRLHRPGGAGPGADLREPGACPRPTR